MNPSHATIPGIEAGNGRVAVHAHGSNVTFSELSSTYPLKLLSPRIIKDNIAVVYVISYGGGLVGGDRVNLSVEIDSHSVLLMLSQGSTKVFKQRPGQRFAAERSRDGASPSNKSQITQQILNTSISSNGALFLLPDAVTCFRSASYSQIQKFHLSGDASLVVLDWVTSGRKSLGEEWAFSRYYSANEVWIDGRRVAKDVMLLDSQEIDCKPLPRRTLAERLAPYSCYATLILYGPLTQAAILDIIEQYQLISVYQTESPDNLIWSLSLITPPGHANGYIVRVAAKETESVKRWLGQTLKKLEEVVGIDTFRRAFL